MDDRERYDFDRCGYLHIPGLLSRGEAANLLDASQALEEHALACRENAPRWKSIWGPEYWQNPEFGYFASGERAAGSTLMVEDFWHFPTAFDMLIGHPRTMEYIRRVIRGPAAINNSELRIRYGGNATGMHMGYPQGSKYRYRVIGGEIDCMMVRMVYFLHDVGPDDGPLCVVPGTHVNSFPCPVQVPVEEEPGAVGLCVRAGDAVLFTEATRHGGFPNRGPRTRYTLHVGYGPDYLKSQNISTMDEEPHVTPALAARLSEEQRALLIHRRRTAMG